MAYRDGKTGRDRVLLTHLFESFDIPAEEDRWSGAVPCADFTCAGAEPVVEVG